MEQGIWGLKRSCARITWGLAKQITGPTPRFSDSLDLEWELWICISNKFQCDADTTGWRLTFENHRPDSLLFLSFSEGSLFPCPRLWQVCSIMKKQRHREIKWQAQPGCSSFFFFFSLAKWGAATGGVVVREIYHCKCERYQITVYN